MNVASPDADVGTEPGPSHPDIWREALFAAELLAVAPQWLGGVIIRARAGVVRDRWLAYYRGLLAPDAPQLRMPAHVTEDRLLGGLDLAATLSSRQLVAERGLLSRADQGVLIAPMAERLSATTVSHLCEVLDHNEVVLERDGITDRLAARISFVALDEGIDEECVAEPLRDRLAFQLNLEAIPAAVAVTPELEESRALVSAARSLLNDVAIDDEARRALCSVAAALGVHSIRGPLLASRVARVSALLSARDAVEEDDISFAARLVLAPRATQFPAPPEDPEEESQNQEPPPPDSDSETGSEQELGRLEDRILEAARSAIPSGLLAELMVAASRGVARSRGPAGAVKQSKTHGRRVGVRRGEPKGGARLNVLETLRAAAPWQTIRRGEIKSDRIEVRRDDFRVHRYQERTETTTIFVVDASGSAALQRLAEAKGAVERVLADCYIRRDQVAMIAFREDSAQMVLPPTKSLVRAKRTLAGLPGGGATPLAAGVDAAVALARDIIQRGQTPVLVFMTDGGANVSRAGVRDRAAAQVDAHASSRTVLALRLATLFVDTSPRARERARELATAMGARYLHLPYSDPARVSDSVQSMATPA